MRDIMGPLMRGIALGDPFTAAEVTLGGASSPGGPQENPWIDLTSIVGNPSWEDSFVGASGAQGGWSTNGVIVDNSHNFGSGSFGGSTGGGLFLRTNSTQNFPGAEQLVTIPSEYNSAIDAGVFEIALTVDVLRDKPIGAGGSSNVAMRRGDNNAFLVITPGAPSEVNAWEAKTATVTMPIGLRTVRLDLRMLRDGAGGFPGAETAFDNVRLQGRIIS